MNTPRPIPEKARRDQCRASDPCNSAWVAANAGSGKTHVLAQRVIRLLLQGTRPDRILCLTFTKAAAANMSERVLRTLAKWSTLPDSELSDAIVATGEPRPQQPAELAHARILFARALETPGGLKTSTIHAFCERLLHIAPFEANIPASFTVLDDRRKEELLARARKDVLKSAQQDASLTSALERIAGEIGSKFQNLFKSALEDRKLFQALNSNNAFRDLRTALGAEPNDSVNEIMRALVEDGLPPSDWLILADFMSAGSVTDQKRASLFREAYASRTSGDFVSAVSSLASIYLAKTDKSRAIVLTKALGRARPDVLDLLETEQDRFIRLWDRLAAVRIADRTIALGVVVNAVQDRYQHLKLMHQCIDFDDMIDRTLTLLSRSTAAWLLKRLDGGIDHVLLDEAQDTSSAQWKIIEHLTDDFYSGFGQLPRARSIFVVGDEKQSIFSFQGSEPELFSEKRKAFERRVCAADGKFESVEMTLSFRSAPGVLAAVDKVFATPERSRGLSGRRDHVPTVHDAWKAEAPSIIELWDVISPQVREQRRNWRLPLDYRDEADPAIVSARRIAGVIAKWLRDGEQVGTGRERRLLRPGDIMILVRRRDAFFEAMIRALKENAVPTAGSDRLNLAQHIAVMDLLATARAALLPEDDLTLATVLKTPLFGLDDDDLLVLAPGRPGSLFDSLQTSAVSAHQSCCAKIDLLNRMARELTPFEFFARVLGPLGGRRAILARLGPESGDVLDEFLNLALVHENEGAPNLQTFIAEVDSLNGTVKRDLDNTDSQVRVMTIHGAKGLEAKIVFLPDVCTTPTGRQDRPFFPLQAGSSGLLPAWSPRKSEDCARLSALRLERSEASMEEYRRLLYVAMTRAEERLYVAGHRGKNEMSSECWRAMIDQAFGQEAVAAPAPWGNGETVLRVFGSESAPPCQDQVVEPPISSAVRIPDWLTTPCRSEEAASQCASAGPNTAVVISANDSARTASIADKPASRPS
jgi:ATP-dependent helicase/nuclease subunit A